MAHKMPVYGRLWAHLTSDHWHMDSSTSILSRVQTLPNVMPLENWPNVPPGGSHLAPALHGWRHMVQDARPLDGPFTGQGSCSLFSFQGPHLLLSLFFKALGTPSA